jgi:hypothetical protein
MFAPRADDLGLDAGVIHLQQASVNSTYGISYKAKVLHRNLWGATPLPKNIQRMPSILASRYRTWQRFFLRASLSS